MSIFAVVKRGGRLYAARVAHGLWLVGTLPTGLEAVRARFPSLAFLDLTDRSALASLVAAFRTDLAARHAKEPADPRTALALAQADLLVGDEAGGRALFEELASKAPGHLSLWTGLAGARAIAGDLDGAERAIDRGIALASRRGALADLRDFERLRARIRAAQRPDSAR